MIHIVPVIILGGILNIVPLLAEDAGIPQFGILGGTVAVTGVLVWYLWYTTSTAFPRIRQDFILEAAEERKHHESMVSKQYEQLNRLVEQLSALTIELKARPCILKPEDR